MKRVCSSLSPFVFALVFASLLNSAALSAEDRSEPNALVLHMRVNEELNSATAKVGQDVQIQVSEAVTKSGKEMIAYGAPVRAHVTRVKQPGHGDRGGQIKLTMTDVQTVSGKWVPVHKGKLRQGHRFIALLAGPCSVPFPLTMLMVGENVTVPKGQQLTAYVQTRDLP